MAVNQHQRKIVIAQLKPTQLLLQVIIFFVENMKKTGF